MEYRKAQQEEKSIIPLVSSLTNMVEEVWEAV